MFPRIHLNLLGWQMTFATSNMLLPFALLVAWFGLSWGMRRKLSFLASTRVVFATVICALLGSRFLHVVWEKPRWYALHPIEVFTRFDGQVLYGAALFGLSGLAFFIRKYSPDIRKQAWDLVAIYAAIMVGILRLSCFAEGCCWGRPTSLPWAVR